MNHRIGEAKKVSRGLQKLWKTYVTKEAKVGMYEGIVEPSLLYRSEALGLNMHERKQTKEVEMNCLRISRVGNEDIKQRCKKNC